MSLPDFSVSVQNSVEYGKVFAVESTIFLVRTGSGGVFLQIFVDGKPWQREEFSSRDDLVVALKSDVMRSGLVVMKIELDGQEISEEGFRASSAGSRADFETQSVRELLRGSFEEGARYFEALFQGLERVCRLFEEEKTVEALGQLQQGIEGVDWLCTVMANAGGLMGTDLTTLAAGDFAKDQEDLSACLREISGALEEGRYFEIAFRIREELIPHLRKLERYWSELKGLTEGTVQ